jgi:hypothetical protein
VRLSNGYRLPFAVRVQAVPASEPVRISIETLNEATEENREQLEAQVQIWLQCAMFGAAAGNDIPPRMASGSLDVYDVLHVYPATLGPNVMHFDATGFVFDISYVNPLLQMLLCLATHLTPLKSVSIEVPTSVSAPEPVHVELSDSSDFPKPTRLSFAFESVDSGSDGVAITVHFARLLTSAEEEVLLDLFLEWQILGAQGGFLSPPFRPEYYVLEASSDPELVETELVWELDEVAVDRRCFEILANMLEAYARSFVPIHSVSVA